MKTYIPENIPIINTCLTGSNDGSKYQALFEERGDQWTKDQFPKILDWSIKGFGATCELAVADLVELTNEQAGVTGTDDQIPLPPSVRRVLEIAFGKYKSALESALDNATHIDIQMSLRYDEGENEYHVDARFDRVRTRDNEPMGEEYQFGQVLDTYSEALDAYYKRGH